MPKQEGRVTAGAHRERRWLGKTCKKGQDVDLGLWLKNNQKPGMDEATGSDSPRIAFPDG